MKLLFLVAFWPVLLDLARGLSVSVTDGHVRSERSNEAGHGAEASSFMQRALQLLELKSNIAGDVYPDSEFYPFREVLHDKKAGRGYVKGSPLYETQAAWVKEHGKTSLGHEDLIFERIPKPWRSTWVRWAHNPGWSFLLLVLQLLVWSAIALLYNMFRDRLPAYEEEKRASRGPDGWSHNPCGPCFSNNDWKICCVSILCPFIRWADTFNQQANLGSQKKTSIKYWQAFFVMIVLSMAAPFTFGLSLVAVSLIGIWYRQRVRKVFNHSPGAGWSYVYDALLWCCLPCLAIAQEAREVEEVQVVDETISNNRPSSRRLTQ